MRDRGPRLDRSCDPLPKNRAPRKPAHRATKPLRCSNDLRLFFVRTSDAYLASSAIVGLSFGTIRRANPSRFLDEIARRIGGRVGNNRRRFFLQTRRDIARMRRRLVRSFRSSVRQVSLQTASVLERVSRRNGPNFSINSGPRSDLFWTETGPSYVPDSPRISRNARPRLLVRHGKSEAIDAEASGASPARERPGKARRRRVFRGRETLLALRMRARLEFGVDSGGSPGGESRGVSQKEGALMIGRGAAKIAHRRRERGRDRSGDPERESPPAGGVSDPGYPGRARSSVEGISRAEHRPRRQREHGVGAESGSAIRSARARIADQTEERPLTIRGHPIDAKADRDDGASRTSRRLPREAITRAHRGPRRPSEPSSQRERPVRTNREDRAARRVRDAHKRARRTRRSAPPRETRVGLESAPFDDKPKPSDVDTRTTTHRPARPDGVRKGGTPGARRPLIRVAFATRKRGDVAPGSHENATARSGPTGHTRTPSDGRRRELSETIARDDLVARSDEADGDYVAEAGRDLPYPQAHSVNAERKGLSIEGRSSRPPRRVEFGSRSSST